MDQRFVESFNNWRRILAAVPMDAARAVIFQNAASDVAVLLAQGLDRTEAADNLFEIALEAGIDDADTVQDIVSSAFTKIEARPKSNGQHAPKPPPALLPLIDIRAWQGVEPPPRQWIVR